MEDKLVVGVRICCNAQNIYFLGLEANADFQSAKIFEAVFIDLSVRQERAAKQVYHFFLYGFLHFEINLAWISLEFFCFSKISELAVKFSCFYFVFEA